MSNKLSQKSITSFFKPSTGNEKDQQGSPNEKKRFRSSSSGNSEVEK